MLGHAIPSLLQHVRHLAAPAAPDEQLLADFLTRHSDEAFAALLGRHGPMVLNVCRRILHDAHAAEDVFQATFLVLARRAGAIQRRASLAGFLHGVAYRLAVRARRRRLPILTTAVCDRAVEPAEGIAWKEMLGILDHELSRLSDHFRAPLVLCYLEGRTQDEAARQLGWSLNTLRRRLAQARRLLEARLRGRGVTLPAALAGLLAARAVAVPGSLRAATLAVVGTRSVAVASAPSLDRQGLALTAAGKKVGALVAMAVLAGAVCFAYCWATQTDQGAVASAPAAPSPAAGADRDDPAADLLLAGAVVRLGTARYRHGNRIESFAVSADGRLAAVTSGWGSFSPARVFDLSDGRCLYSLPHKPDRGFEAVGLSPDGKILATKDGEDVCFREATTGKVIRRVRYLQAPGGRTVTDWLTFTPDGKYLAATLLGDTVHLIDVETGAVKRTFERRAAARACVFSPDGKLMVTGGYEQDDGVYYACLWEVATGKELRRFALAFERNQPIEALAFSPDGSKLAGAAWRDGRLRLFEVATGKELRVFPRIGENVPGVAFAPDGKTVAAAGDRIYLYDPVTGKERLRIERRARGLAFSRDGSVLTGAVSGAIYRWDVASGRQLSPTAAQDSAVEQVLVSPDGRSVFTTDQEGSLHVWDMAGGKPPRRIIGGAERGVVASPDGRFLACVVAIDAQNPDPSGRKWYQIASRVRLYDVARRQVLDRLPGFPGQAAVVAFLPDGKTLLTLGGGLRDPVARLWDVESGREVRSFAVALTSDTRIRPVVGRRMAEGIPFFTWRRAALAPDGKTLAVGPDWEENLHVHSDEPVRLWDVATGKAGPELKRPSNALGVQEEAGTGTVDDLSLIRVNRKMNSSAGRTFSPDGRLLVDWALNPFGPSRMDHLYVWDMATGKAVATLTAGPRNGVVNAAFAPDSRTLATASVDGTVLLWEVATWKVRAELHGHRDQVTALAFGPDGRLFSGGLDTVVLGWDVRPPRAAIKGTLADAWQALAHSDAKGGFQAQGRFLAEPGKAVEWCAGRLAPARRPDPARVKSLLDELDTDDFAAREKATTDLKKLWPYTEAGLREMVANASSLEARRRAERIVREMETGTSSADELRSLRAVEVLEWLGTKEARKVLNRLTQGVPEARLTRAAAASSKRLEGRK